MKKYILVGTILLVADQLSKLFAIENFQEKIVVIEDFFTLRYVENYGVGFSMLNGQYELIIFLSIIGLVFMGYLLYYYRYNKYYAMGLTVMIAGAIGNFLDRLFRGYVVDFLDFIFFGIDFAVFNFADLYLVFGMIYIIILVVLEELGKFNADN